MEQPEGRFVPQNAFCCPTAEAGLSDLTNREPGKMLLATGKRFP